MSDQHIPYDIKLWSAPLSVRWGDMDALGHVNNGEYMRYFEEARVAWSQHHGLRVPQSGCGMVIVKATMQYLKPVVYPAQIHSEVFAGHIGNSSFTLHQRLSLQDDHSVTTTGDFVVVWFDFTHQRSTPIPERMRAILRGEAR